MIETFFSFFMVTFSIIMLLFVLPDIYRMIFPRRNRKRKQTRSRYIDNNFIRRA